VTIVQCEVCGRYISGKPHNVIIERAKMVVCGNCSGLGTVYWEAPPSKATPSKKRVIKKDVRFPQRIPSKKQQSATPQTLELVEDFSLRIRQARKKLGLSHEDLGRKIGEKISVLRKIESGKMIPDNRLTNKLEHALKTKLLVPFTEPQLPQFDLSPPRETTLGDLVHIKEKKGEVNEEREPS